HARRPPADGPLARGQLVQPPSEFTATLRKMSPSLPVPSLTRSLLAAAFVLLLLVPAARSDSATVSWASPTPADQAQFSVSTGKSVKFTLSASTAVIGGERALRTPAPVCQGGGTAP